MRRVLAFSDFGLPVVDRTAVMERPQILGLGFFGGSLHHGHIRALGKHGRG